MLALYVRGPRAEGDKALMVTHTLKLQLHNINHQNDFINRLISAQSRRGLINRCYSQLHELPPISPCPLLHSRFTPLSSVTARAAACRHDTLSLPGRVTDGLMKRQYQFIRRKRTNVGLFGVAGCGTVTLRWSEVTWCDGELAATQATDHELKTWTGFRFLLETGAWTIFFYLF